MLQHTKQRFSTLYILILEAQLIEVEIYIETFRKSRLLVLTFKSCWPPFNVEPTDNK